MSLVGRHIGRYRILEQLGQGGMSVVYKGLDTQLEREVAVKVLHSHLAAKEESRRRLAREAKAVARLHHPNILEVYDYADTDAEQAFIVTEYIRGQTLRQYSETVGLEPPEVAAMVIHEVASALAQAHDAGIIHRDLKPENVMVRHDGVIKLMDFGIAKIIDRDDKMTMTGALVGSPAHMAPEIIEGEEAGAEADVFSLGTMLFFFATGRLPFTAPNTTATLKKILDGVYDDPRQLVPTVSDDLAEIIATCLARQPSSRYPNAGKLKDALQDYLSPLGLSRTNEELASFFADPPSYRKTLVPRLSKALIERSEALIAEKRPARALAALNQVLAHDPNNARALQLLQEMNVARKKQRQTKLFQRVALIATFVVLLAGSGALAFRALTAPPDYVAPLNPVTELVVPKSAFTPPPAPAVKAPEPKQVEPALSVTPQKDPPRKEVKPASALTPVTVPVVINVRPYGFVEIDGQTRTDERAQHALSLAPGPHTLRYGCQFCVPAQETITVQKDAPNELHLAVESLPATLAFDFQPANATVKVRGETRPVAESLRKPFTVRSAKGPSDLRHKVEYEITAPGYKPLAATVLVRPGENRTVSGELTRE